MTFFFEVHKVCFVWERSRFCLNLIQRVWYICHFIIIKFIETKGTVEKSSQFTFRADERYSFRAMALFSVDFFLLSGDYVAIITTTNVSTIWLSVDVFLSFFPQKLISIAINSKTIKPESISFFFGREPHLVSRSLPLGSMKMNSCFKLIIWQVCHVFGKSALWVFALFHVRRPKFDVQQKDDDTR